MITGGQVGPVAHLVKAELYDALILLGIPYRCKSDGFDYEKAVTEGLNSETGKRFCTQTGHPYRAAWVRLVRRAVMNAYVNQTGQLPFEYETDEEDFKESFFIRSDKHTERRKKNKRQTNYLKEGQSLPLIRQLLATDMPIISAGADV